jgi:tRNA G46 methylase TrmB
MVNAVTSPLPPIIPGVINPDYLRHSVGIEAAVILEIGANDGSHTGQLLKLFPRATIFAFEPDPRALAKLKANVSDPGCAYSKWPSARAMVKPNFTSAAAFRRQPRRNWRTNTLRDGISQAR